MHYWNVSHYRKFFTKDDDLVTNNVFYGKETASCYHTDIKPKTNESEFMIKKIAEKYGYDRGGLRNYLEQWLHIKNYQHKNFMRAIIQEHLLVPL